MIYEVSHENFGNWLIFKSKNKQKSTASSSKWLYFPVFVSGHNQLISSIAVFILYLIISQDCSSLSLPSHALTKGRPKSVRVVQSSLNRNSLFVFLLFLFLSLLTDRFLISLLSNSTIFTFASTCSSLPSAPAFFRNYFWFPTWQLSILHHYHEIVSFCFASFSSLGHYQSIHSFIFASFIAARLLCFIDFLIIYLSFLFLVHKIRIFFYFSLGVLIKFIKFGIFGC